MKMIASLAAPVLVLLGGASPAPADVDMALHNQQRNDQRAAFSGRREGRILPLREIEGRVVPRMRGAQYLGFDFDSSSAIYTLKFLRDGTVIWVEVDGQSGRIVGQSGR